MKITTEFTQSTYDLIEIISAVYLGDYALRIYFNDSSNKVVDFKYFLENSMHPSIRKYLDEKIFKEFEIVDGNLNWQDYDLIFPIEDLYQGNV
jgi:DUF971 family protein